MGKILLVDDDQSARVTLSIALKSAGFSVEIVDNGRKALQRLGEDSYEWVISDVNMPDLDGVELVRKIREQDHEIRIVLISAFRSPDEIQGLQIQGFLEKPINVRKLYAILRNEPVSEEEEFAPRINRTSSEFLHEEDRRSKDPEIIQFKDEMEKQEFEKMSFNVYELLEKKVEERTQELLEKQRNLEDAYYELRKTKRYLENLIDASPNCIISTDIEMGILSCNTAAEETFGYTRDELLGQSMAALRAPEAEEMSHEIYARTLEAGSWTGEIAGRRRDGEVFPLSLVTSRVVDEEGRIIAILEMSREITEEKKMEQQLLYAEKLSVLGQLAPKIAHEINNPLHVISANAQLGLMVIDDKEKVRSCLHKVFNETDRIEHLTRQLMDVARPTELNIRELSVVDLLENALLFLRDVGEIKRLEVHKEYSERLPKIHADQAQMEQVFRNLILNASQAMEESAEKCLTVAVRPAEDSDFIEVLISDTGCGIPEEYREQIFEPFFTTKKVGKGNGLGMPIIRGIVQRHQGRIEVESEVGAGSTFHIFLRVNCSGRADPLSAGTHHGRMPDAGEEKVGAGIGWNRE
ncbi:MAG: response regulator [Deltaproteobacteria bacterium]|nr:response regulator [Deltaproteobacteria bacterium]